MKFKTYLRNTEDFPLFDENPTLEYLMKSKSVRKDFKNVWLNAKDQPEYVNKDTGEVLNMTAVATNQKKLKDYRKFHKLFCSGTWMLSELSNYELKVYLYILSVIDKDKDYFYFSMRDCKKICNYKNESVIHAALTGLLERRIIARTRDGFKFWINPMYIFNGTVVPSLERYKDNYERVENYKYKNSNPLKPEPIIMEQEVEKEEDLEE